MHEKIGAVPISHSHFPLCRPFVRPKVIAPAPDKSVLKTIKDDKSEL
jgi:hypothetical protein